MCASILNRGAVQGGGVQGGLLGSHSLLLALNCPHDLQSSLMMSLTPPLSVCFVQQKQSDASAFTCHLLPHTL